MLGSSAVVTLTLLFSGASYALPNNDVLPPGIDGTGGPRDLYAAAGATPNSLGNLAEERGEFAELTKMPEESPGFAGIFPRSPFPTEGCD
jgi:hypothetical protein